MRVIFFVLLLIPILTFSQKEDIKDTCKEELKAANETISELQSQLEATKLKKKEVKLRDVTKEKDRYQDLFEATDAKRKSLEKRSDSLERIVKKLSPLPARISKNENEIDSLKRKLDELENFKQHLLGKNSDLEKKADNIPRLENEIQQLKNDNLTCKKELSKLQEAFKELEESIEPTKRELKKTKNLLQAILNDFIHDIYEEGKEGNGYTENLKKAHEFVAILERWKLVYPGLEEFPDFKSIKKAVSFFTALQDADSVLEKPYEEGRVKNAQRLLEQQMSTINFAKNPKEKILKTNFLEDINKNIILLSNYCKYNNKAQRKIHEVRMLQSDDDEFMIQKRIREIRAEVKEKYPHLYRELNKRYNDPTYICRNIEKSSSCY